MDNGIPAGAPRCRCCGRLIDCNPRLGDRQQHYCRERACQLCRKAKWNRDKYAADPVFCAAEKTRVSISRRTQGTTESIAGLAAAQSAAGTGLGLLQLQAQVTEMRLQITGMASFATGIENAADLALCVERYKAQGRVLQLAQLQV